MPTTDQDPQLTPLSPDGDGTLGWENSYEIALTLHQRHPDIDLEEVSLGMIYHWTIDLPNFLDDRELANDQILLAIYREWLEEVNPI